ncbi:IclR family transcriptional regulator [Variovorax paradoxus]|uniref:IclR family transcriptional regulator n=1 Tax=Variovorax paradoxus TaxID=34073 RepID=UPI002783C4C4|nr:IclR family transcriptional regulator [Variovorax paradoxus]MDQ0591498.1 DNA-binding IclR family transcriptional regulator [Variovorax paradoxus]
MNDSAGSKEEVGALGRGLALLKVIGMAAAPMSNRELADTTGLPKATVSRLTATLVGAGYLRQSQDSERFSLGPALLDMSSSYLRHFDLRTVARPYLSELSEFAGASVHVAVRDELDMVVIDSLRPRSVLISSRLEVGTRMTMVTSAAGRASLAALPAAEQATVLQQIRQESGENWASIEPRLLAGLDEYARLGYCSSFGEWHPHIHALGFALHGPHGERYGVSCGGPAYLLPKEMMLGRVASKLLEIAQRISGETGTVSTD